MSRLVRIEDCAGRPSQKWSNPASPLTGMRLALRLDMVVVCLLVAAAVLGRPAAADAQTWQAAYEAGDYQRAASLLQPLVIAAMDQATPDELHDESGGEDGEGDWEWEEGQ